jgi:hypothetical protein
MVNTRISHYIGKVYEKIILIFCLKEQIQQTKHRQIKHFRKCSNIKNEQKLEIFIDFLYEK